MSVIILQKTSTISGISSEIILNSLLPASGDTTQHDTSSMQLCVAGRPVGRILSVGGKGSGGWATPPFYLRSLPLPAFPLK